MREKNVTKIIVYFNKYNCAQRALFDENLCLNDVMKCDWFTISLGFGWKLIRIVVQLEWVVECAVVVAAGVAVVAVVVAVMVGDIGLVVAKSVVEVATIFRHFVAAVVVLSQRYRLVDVQHQP